MKNKKICNSDMRTSECAYCKMGCLLIAKNTKEYNKLRLERTKKCERNNKSKLQGVNK